MKARLLLTFYIFLICLGLFVFGKAIVNKCTKGSDIVKDQKQQIVLLQAQTADLQLRNKRLQRAHKWAVIFEQILPPCGVEEWDLMAKQIREWKETYKPCDRK